MKRYYVTCQACGGKTGTNPPGIGLDKASQEAATVDCMQCGMPVPRKDGQYLRAKQIHEPEADLLALE